MTGVVYIVGAGPGAADLLTLRAARLLAQADVVLHDALVSEQVLALAVNARLYNVGKRARRPSVDQRLICRLLVRMGLRHEIVVRLKGGDPHIFGRATEEMDACRRAGVPVVTVPGVSAGVAAAASVGASLTARGVSRSVAFVTPSLARGREDDLHWAKAAAAAETVVVYMGALHAERVVRELRLRGVPSRRPVAIVENASAEGERIIRGVLEDLPDLCSRLREGPAVIIVGEAVAEAHAMLKGAHAA